MALTAFPARDVGLAALLGRSLRRGDRSPAARASNRAHVVGRDEVLAQRAVEREQVLDDRRGWSVSATTGAGVALDHPARRAGSATRRR